MASSIAVYPATRPCCAAALDPRCCRYQWAKCTSPNHALRFVRQAHRPLRYMSHRIKDVIWAYTFGDSLDTSSIGGSCGTWLVHQTGAKLAAEIKPLLREQLVKCIGGCCGTGPKPPSMIRCNAAAIANVLDQLFSEQGGCLLPSQHLCCGPVSWHQVGQHFGSKRQHTLDNVSAWQGLASVFGPKSVFQTNCNWLEPQANGRTPELLKQLFTESAS